jgi:hypothetical protein
MAASRKRYIVDFDAGAVRDFVDVKGKEERNALLNAVDKLGQLGPKLVPPHAKPLQGEPDLWELRPRQGRSKCRPLFVRVDDDYPIVAIAVDHDKDIDDAVQAARERLKDRAGGPSYQPRVIMGAPCPRCSRT